jgi:hypothetical protein
MGPTAFLHEVVMKVPAPATGTPNVQNVDSRITPRSIPKDPKLHCRKRNRILQELRNVKTRVRFPSHIYITRCGSLFTWIRAQATTPRYCRAHITIYLYLLIILLLVRVLLTATVTSPLQSFSSLQSLSMFLILCPETSNTDQVLLTLLSHLLWI